MKNPNGYGTVFKLSGNRRKPWAVRITTGWDNKGKQKHKYLDYFVTRQEALIALADYNSNPYDLSARKITFEELYEKFTNERFPKMSPSSKGGYKMAFDLSESLHHLKFIDIRKSHMQLVIDNLEKSHDTKRVIKVLYNQLYKHAMENDLIHKNYAEYVSLPKNTSESSRKPFSSNEIKLLWENLGKVEDIDLVLIMIYTGLRPGELTEIKSKNVHLDKRYLIGGFKTEAGTNRVIPIHKRIHKLIEKRMLLNNKNLISTYKGGSMSYYTLYHNRWKDVMAKLRLDHRPHDCRHTFATLMDNAGANKSSIRRIIGHASKDITEKVYTHKSIKQLILAIDMLD